MARPTEIFETQFFHFDDAERPLKLRCGAEVPAFTLAYEAYGEMNEAKDNVILLFHALSGSQHAAGLNESLDGLSVTWTKECQGGWWDDFVGPGKALNTDKFCVICANYLGGCYGSTGPASVDPATGKPYGSSFPRISVSDIVDSQVRLLDHLGVDKLHATVGASLGGLMALSLATRYAERVGVIVSLGSGIEVSRLQRIHNFEQIYAIESDAAFNGGDYYEGAHPNRGLAAARMISHKTFISLSTMEKRATKEIRRRKGAAVGWYQIESPLESYIHHQGIKFVKRFDANTYLRIIDAWQSVNLLKDAGAEDYAELFADCGHQRYLIFTIDSDVCFYPDHQTQLNAALQTGGVMPMRITVHSEKGHDSFLLEPELFTPHISHLLEG
ncbi:MAG: homoserine O-acetyltransferase [Verrucomicrobiales bacterium]|jgi:homoserine O-acetyltransferase